MNRSAAHAAVEPGPEVGLVPLPAEVESHPGPRQARSEHPVRGAQAKAAKRAYVASYA